MTFEKGVDMDAEVAVIGVGTMGSMAMWRLAERGVEAIGFERYAPGHDLGAAGGNTRLFRLAYMEGAHYVPLLKQALGLWGELSEVSATNLLVQCGGLNIGRREDPSMRQVAESARVHGLKLLPLGRAEMADRYPQHVLAEDDMAYFDPEAGFLRSEQAVVAAADRAESLGARILRRHRVERVEPRRDGVVIEAAGSTWKVRTAILAMGSWAPSWLPPELARHLRPKRVLLSWFAPAYVQDFEPEVFPVFTRQSGGDFLYGAPTADHASVKVCGIRPSDIDDPDTFERRHDPDELTSMAELLTSHVTGLHPYPVRSAGFTDLYSSDGHGITGRHPRLPNVVLAGGYSGRGFKLAPAVGDAVARLATGETVPDIAFMAPDRFAGGRR
ncbi:sarcosine oxidase [Actinomadura madurae]|uniref:Sarcosine oxidase n=1 Tax=Actinomadura madurae TaxID=1993 RepID=A0A1I5RIC4_9ACTN|nr:N-methyl-L-tryptophan oxidase [Actinomadura madurae]SFP58283.1 sarcosine oxidase [Actinomadura madurae]